MLIEDNAPSRRILARVLEAQGYEVAEVGTGSEGLLALETGPAPAVVLTDVQLPDLDGREIALAARQLDPVPFVALITGWPVGDEPGGAIGSSPAVDHVFLKPVRLDDLLARLDEALGRPA